MPRRPTRTTATSSRSGIGCSERSRVARSSRGFGTGSTVSTDRTRNHWAAFCDCRSGRRTDVTMIRRGALILVVTVAFTGVTARGALAQAGKLDTQRIDEITGLKGTFTEQEGVFKVTAPRADTKVAVD